MSLEQTTEVDPLVAQHTNHQPYWKRAILFGVIVMILGFLLDISAHWFYQKAFPQLWWEERFWENTIEGTCVAIVALFIILDKRRRMQERTQARLCKIAYLNHSALTALTTIVMSQDDRMEVQQRIGMVKESSSQIQRCLEEISREEDMDNSRNSPR